MSEKDLRLVERRLRATYDALAALTNDTAPPLSADREQRRPVLPRRHRFRPLVAIGVAVAVLAVAAGFLVVARNDSHRTVSTATRSAAGNKSVASTIPPGEYFYVRTSGFAWAGSVGSAYVTMTRPYTYEAWVASDGSGRLRKTFGPRQFLTPENETAFHEAGGTVADLRVEPNSDERFGPGDLGYVDLSSVPVEREALRAWLNERLERHHSSPDYARQLIEEINDWGWLMNGPVANKKALVDVLRTSPGMNAVVDQGMVVVSADTGGVRAELWFDQRTGTLRRYRQVISDNSQVLIGWRAPSGTVVQDFQLEKATLVTSIESTPAQHPTETPTATSGPPSTAPNVPTQPCVLRADPGDIYALAQPAMITVPDGRIAPIVPGNPITEPMNVTLDSDGSTYPGKESTRAAGLWGSAADGGPFSGLDAAAIGDTITLHQATSESDCTQRWRIVRIYAPPSAPKTEPTLLRLVGYVPRGETGPSVQFYVDAVPQS